MSETKQNDFAVEVNISIAANEYGHIEKALEQVKKNVALCAQDEVLEKYNWYDSKPDYKAAFEIERAAEEISLGDSIKITSVAHCHCAIPRISTKPTDKYYRADNSSYRVLLNGVEINDCITADAIEGYVERILLTPEGHPLKAVGERAGFTWKEQGHVLILLKDGEVI